VGKKRFSNMKTTTTPLHIAQVMTVSAQLSNYMTSKAYIDMKDFLSRLHPLKRPRAKPLLQSCLSMSVEQVPSLSYPTDTGTSSFDSVHMCSLKYKLE
jgi:hypothetical protein